MMKMNLFLFLIFLGFTEGAKILMIMPLLTKSHNTMFVHESKILAERGHKITLVTPYPLKETHPNIEQLQVGDPSKLNENEEHQYFDRKQELHIEFIYSFTGFFVDSCEDVYKHDQVKSMIDFVTTNKGAKLYDLAIVELLPTECALPFTSLVANHTMLTSVVPVPFWNAVEMRIPILTSISSMVFLTDFGTPATFSERFINTFNSFVTYGIWKFRYMPRMQVIANNYLPPWAPSVFDALNEVCFILTNEDVLSVSPRTNLPYMAQVSGVHLKEPKPLSKEIQDFIESSGEDGAILFTFGSFLNTRNMPVKMRNEILGTLGKLKQKVLFKYHEPVATAPENVKILPWLPQSDILAHPKIRLFITHGGILSAQEVMYHGVPFVGIPVFADQHQNIAMLEEFGMGEVLSLHNITVEALYNIVTKVLNNESYAERAKEARSVMRDRQNSAADTIIYWTEYLIRHKGAPYLKDRVSHKLYLFQYLLLDVLAVIFLMIGLCSAAAVLTVKLLLNVVIRNLKSKEKNS